MRAIFCEAGEQHQQQVQPSNSSTEQHQHHHGWPRLGVRSPNGHPVACVRTLNPMLSLRHARHATNFSPTTYVGVSIVELGLNNDGLRSLTRGGLSPAARSCAVPALRPLRAGDGGVGAACVVAVTVAASTWPNFGSAVGVAVGVAPGRRQALGDWWDITV